MSYQVSVFLENRLGRLEKVTSVLREGGINIRSIHLNHTANGWGILNLVVSDPEKALGCLSRNDLSAALREIVVVEMCDAPGGLDILLKDVVRVGVNFTNAYGMSARQGDDAFFVIDVEDIPDARQRLEAAGLRILDDRTVYGG